MAKRKGRRQIDDPSSEPQLNHQDEEPSRRKFFQRSGAIAAFTTAAAASLLLEDDSRRPSKKLSRPIDSEPQAPNQEVLTDQLIAELEKGMENFREILEPKLSTIKDEKYRKHLLLPFDIVRHNAKNPFKNRRRAERLHRHTNVIRMKSIYQFHYLAAAIEGAAGAYNPPSKTLFANPDFDPENMMDMLTIYHELWHVIDDSGVRLKLTPDQERRYLKFWSRIRDNKVDINTESWANAFSIEIADLLLDGEIRETVESGRRFDIQGILKRLNAGADDKNLLIIMLGMSQGLYPEGIQKWPLKLPEKYYKNLTRIYKILKRKAYFRMPDGSFKEFDGSISSIR